MRANFEETKKNLQHLTNTIAQSGYEDKIISVINDMIAPYAYKKEVDNMGNIIINIFPENHESKNRIMLFAHMDEIGFIIKKIEEDGFLRLERLGGISEKTMAGQSIIIETQENIYQGVIGTKSHHLTKKEEKYKVLPIDEVYADFGFDSKESVLNSGIRVGDPVANCRQFFSNDNIIFSNTIDNRIGCLALIEIIEKIQKNKDHFPEIHVVFSVQEEFNLRGILPAVRKINPDIAIALDIAVSHDTPDLIKQGNIKLGNGPVVNKFSFHGRGTLGGLIPNPKLVDHVLNVAGNNNINVQQNVFMGGLTDASFSQLENEGIPMIELGIPTRYSHAPIEAMDLNDYFDLLKLLEEILISFDNKIELGRG